MTDAVETRTTGYDVVEKWELTPEQQKAFDGVPKEIIGLFTPEEIETITKAINEPKTKEEKPIFNQKQQNFFVTSIRKVYNNYLVQKANNAALGLDYFFEVYTTSDGNFKEFIDTLDALGIEMKRKFCQNYPKALKNLDSNFQTNFEKFLMLNPEIRKATAEKIQSSKIRKEILNKIKENSNGEEFKDISEFLGSEDSKILGLEEYEKMLQIIIDMDEQIHKKQETISESKMSELPDIDSQIKEITRAINSEDLKKIKLDDLKAKLLNLELLDIISRLSEKEYQICKKNLIHGLNGKIKSAVEDIIPKKRRQFNEYKEKVLQEISQTKTAAKEKIQEIIKLKRQKLQEERKRQEDEKERNQQEEQKRQQLAQEIEQSKRILQEIFEMLSITDKKNLIKSEIDINVASLTELDAELKKIQACKEQLSNILAVITQLQTDAETPEAKALFESNFANDDFKTSLNESDNFDKVISLFSEKINQIALYYDEGKGDSQDMKKAIELYKIASALDNTDAMSNLSTCYYDGDGVPKDEKEAVKLLERASALGDTDAMNNLGSCYLNSDGVQKYDKKAVELLQQAVILGNAAAMNNLGSCYFNGNGVKQDKKKAVELLNGAVILNNPDAMFNLACLYQDGDGVTQNTQKAVELLQRAVTLGNAAAMNNLAYCYQHGLGVPKDEKKALELYYGAADQDHVGALFNLGCLIIELADKRNKEIIEHDREECKGTAFELFERAAKKGHVGAMYNLACMYQHGLGVPKDEKKAIEFYTKAAKKGHAGAIANLGWYYQNIGLERAVKQCQRGVILGNSSAMNNLAYCYQHGLGVPKDEKKALELYYGAADQDHVGALFNLGCLIIELADKRNKEIIEHDREECKGTAFVFFERAAEKGHVGAMYNLARMCQDGDGVPQDKKKAIEFYTKAAKKGHAGAMYNLTCMCQDGDGVLKNKKKVSKLFKRAAKLGHVGTMVVAINLQNDDLKNAAKLYQRGTDLGNLNAMNNLAYCYQYGLGVPQNKEKAVELLQQVADEGRAEAIYNLGFCYQQGDGVPKDEKKAVELFKRALGLNEFMALGELIFHVNRGLGIKQNILWAAKARPLFEQLKDNQLPVETRTGLLNEAKKLLEDLEKEQTKPTAVVSTNSPVPESVFGSPTTTPPSAGAIPDSQNPQNQAQGEASKQAQGETQVNSEILEQPQQKTTERPDMLPQGRNGDGEGICR